MFRYLVLILPLITFLGCGRKAPPKVPQNYIFPPEVEKTTKSQQVGKTALPKGVGGFFIGDDGFAVLYWDFPFKVEKVQVYKNGKLIATLEETNTFTDTTSKVKEGTTYRIVGLKGGKPAAEVVIKIQRKE
jgi:predicted small lipoprotein YifL